MASGSPLTDMIINGILILIEQVSIATLSLERRLEEESPNLFKKYRFSTAVCFPDVDISSNLSYLEQKHQRITIDALRMQNLREAIIEVMKDNHEKFDPPGEARILMLKELVACSWYINSSKSIQIYDTENEIKKLTEKQFKLLYQLAPTAHRLLISGCAGSGKTILAAEIASRMVRLDKKRVLFTCYNRNLALWLRTSSFFVDNGLMMVSNYQKLCADFARNWGISHGKGYKALSELNIEPEFVPIPDTKKEHQVVREVVERLIEKEKITSKDIAILTPLSQYCSA